MDESNMQVTPRPLDVEIDVPKMHGYHLALKALESIIDVSFVLDSWYIDFPCCLAHKRISVRSQCDLKECASDALLFELLHIVVQVHRELSLDQLAELLLLKQMHPTRLALTVKSGIWTAWIQNGLLYQSKQALLCAVRPMLTPS